MTVIDILNSTLSGKKIVYYEWWIGDKISGLYLHNEPHKSDMTMFNYKFVRKTAEILKITKPKSDARNVYLVEIAIHTKVELENETFDKIFDIYCTSGFEIED